MSKKRPLIAEVIEEMGMEDKAVGVSPVGCAVFAYTIGTKKTLAKWALRAFMCQCANDFSHIHTIGKKIHIKYIYRGETRARARGTSRFDGRNPTAKTERKICAKICPKFCAENAAEITAPNF